MSDTPKLDNKLQAMALVERILLNSWDKELFTLAPINPQEIFDLREYLRSALPDAPLSGAPDDRARTQRALAVLDVIEDDDKFAELNDGVLGALPFHDAELDGYASALRTALLAITPPDTQEPT